ncbi:MAG: histidine--tRNA ligase, partial [Winogradskyella sp.]|nr:histidine--tRNA ligase [Winogradskyella sp.]
GIFGLKGVSGVGVSFGLDRIYLVLEELNLFPDSVNASTHVLFINFGDKEALYALKAIQKLRAEGINAELYPEASKLKKQFGYADKRNIPFTIIVGEEEMRTNTYSLKNMSSGEQLKLNLAEIIDQLAII